MNTSLKRSDLADGIESLTAAYREAVHELEQADQLADQRIHDLIQISWEVVSDEFQFMDRHIPLVLEDPKAVSAHKETVEQLVAAVRSLDSKNIEIWSGKLFRTLENYLKRVNKVALDWAVRVRGIEGETAPEAVPAQNERRSVMLLLARVEQAELSHQLRLGTQLAKSAVQAAEKAAEDARTAAGVASRSKLTERFEALAKRHFQAATLFRILTTIGVLAGIIWASLHAEAASGTGTTTAEAILRVSLLAGVLGLATYFGRQAAYHRDVSTWASTIKEQLLTFDGYIDPVDDSQLRDQMRAAFAARVFGSSPEAKDEPGVTLSSPVLSEVAALFTKAGSSK